MIFNCNSVKKVKVKKKNNYIHWNTGFWLSTGTLSKWQDTTFKHVCEGHTSLKTRDIGVKIRHKNKQKPNYLRFNYC